MNQAWTFELIKEQDGHLQEAVCIYKVSSQILLAQNINRRLIPKRKFSCFYDTQLPTVCRLPFAVNVMLNLSIETSETSGYK